MNASLSEDSVAETALAKKNSDGKCCALLCALYRNTKRKFEVIDMCIENLDKSSSVKFNGDAE